MRCTTLQFISYAIGNGTSTSLWFEPWWRGGCLASTKYSLIIRLCGMPSNAMVSSLLSTNGWMLPHPNSWHHHLDRLLIHWLHTFNHPIFNLEAQDCIMWDIMNIGQVKTWHVWENIRSRAEEVPWFLVVWHKLRIIAIRITNG